jgi:hypothetical protein
MTELTPSLPSGDHDCDECGGTGRVSDPQAAPYGGQRYKLERGWRKRWLILQLASAEASGATLAHALGVNHSSVYTFARRHAGEIADVRADLEREFVALWIADKRNRLAEYQQDVEDVNDVVGRAMEPAQPKELDPLDPGDLAAREEAFGGSDIPNWLRVKHAALKAAAEELGQIPNRVQMDLTGTVLTYELVGADLDDV